MNKKTAENGSLLTTEILKTFIDSIMHSDKCFSLDRFHDMVKIAGICIDRDDLVKWFSDKGYTGEGFRDISSYTMKSFDLIRCFRLNVGDLLSSGYPSEELKITGKGLIFFINKLLNKECCADGSEISTGMMNLFIRAIAKTKSTIDIGLYSGFLYYFGINIKSGDLYDWLHNNKYIDRDNGIICDQVEGFEILRMFDVNVKMPDGGYFGFKKIGVTGRGFIFFIYKLLKEIESMNMWDERRKLYKDIALKMSSVEIGKMMGCCHEDIVENIKKLNVMRGKLLLPLIEGVNDHSLWDKNVQGEIDYYFLTREEFAQLAVFYPDWSMNLISEKWEDIYESANHHRLESIPVGNVIESEGDTPKERIYTMVDFTPEGDVSIRGMTNILIKHGFNINEFEFARWLRLNNYTHYRGFGETDAPESRAFYMDIFRPGSGWDLHTPLAITPAGQIHFLNKFLNDRIEGIDWDSDTNNKKNK